MAAVLDEERVRLPKPTERQSSATPAQTLLQELCQTECTQAWTIVVSSCHVLL